MFEITYEIILIILINSRQSLKMSGFNNSSKLQKQYGSISYVNYGNINMIKLKF